MLRLLLFLLLIASLEASMSYHLKKLCLSPLIDSPRKEDNFMERIKGETCVQTFPYPGSEEQHDTFCRNQLPFDYTVERRTESEVTCKWTASSVCRRVKEVQIFDKCYSVSSNPCYNSKLAKPVSSDEVRWISILFGDTDSYQTLHVEQSKAFADKLKSGYFFDGTLVKEADGRTTKRVMVVSRMAAFGLYPGDFVDSIEYVNYLCYVKADIIGPVSSTEIELLKSQSPPPLTTVKENLEKLGSGYGHRIIPLPEGFMSPTRNSYQARLENDGQLVDVNHFHRICGRICKGCFAATYETFEKHKHLLPDGRFYVPARTSQKETKYKAEGGSCGDSYKKEDAWKFKAKTSATNHFYTPSIEQWAKEQKIPTIGCSDGDRMAVQIVKSGNSLTYVDVPTFDYQPVMCVSGSHMREASKLQRYR